MKKSYWILILFLVIWLSSCWLPWINSEKDDSWWNTSSSKSSSWDKELKNSRPRRGTWATAVDKKILEDKKVVNDKYKEFLKLSDIEKVKYDCKVLKWENELDKLSENSKYKLCKNEIRKLKKKK